MISLALGGLLVVAVLAVVRLGGKEPLASPVLAKALVGKGELSATLEPAWFEQRWTERSSAGTGIGLPFDPVFRVGVQSLDLEVALAVRQTDVAAILARRLARALSDFAGTTDLVAGYDRLAEQLESRDRGSMAAAKRVSGRLAEMTAEAEALDDLRLTFGLWCEAGRLAGLSSNVDLLTSRSFREFVPRLDERRNRHPRNPNPSNPNPGSSNPWNTNPWNTNRWNANPWNANPWNARVAVEIDRLRDLLRPELNDLQVAAIAVSFEAIVAGG